MKSFFTPTVAFEATYILGPQLTCFRSDITLSSEVTVDAFTDVILEASALEHGGRKVHGQQPAPGPLGQTQVKS